MLLHLLCAMSCTDNEFLESPVDTSLNTGSIVTLRCVHKFGRAYAWFSNQRPLYDSLEKVSVHVMHKN